jgi:hypothetical protein
MAHLHHIKIGAFFKDQHLPVVIDTEGLLSGKEIEIKQRQRWGRPQRCRLFPSSYQHTSMVWPR